MRLVYLIIVTALLALASGIGVTWARFGNPPPELLPESIQGPQAAAKKLAPKVLVGEKSYNFGPVDRDTKVRHAFRLENVGQGVLSLKAGPTTCAACTIAELSKTEVAPGEYATVTVEYSTGAAKPTFTQVARVLTNDPEQRTVELEISGTVASRFQILPENLVLTNVAADTGGTGELRIYSYLANEVRVTAHECLEADTAQYFDVSSEPLAPADITEPRARGGCRVIVTLKPGLPLGAIRQTIRLTLDSGPGSEPSPLAIPVDAKIVSDISIVGPKWNSETATLSIGNVKSAEGATRKLTLLVRGEHRNAVQIEPLRVQPEQIKVSLGQVAPLSDTVSQIPLTVEIPPGMSPGIYLGTEQSKPAEILLGVKNHPQLKEIKINLRFLIGN